MQLLEHIHIDVRSLAETEIFLRTALPEIERRGSGNGAGSGRWVHLGSDDNYIALTEDAAAKPAASLRHIGMVVESVDQLMQRLAEAGFEPADAGSLNSHPYRRRVYYIDGNGLDWEFVEYLSDDLSKRND